MIGTVLIILAALIMPAWYIYEAAFGGDYKLAIRVFFLVGIFYAIILYADLNGIDSSDDLLIFIIAAEVIAQVVITPIFIIHDRKKKRK